MDRIHHRYSAELKQRMVAEIESGHLSLREAARDAQTTVTQVQKWLEEYGRFKPKRDVVEVVMKSEQDRIAALEKALADAHLKLEVYDELIVQANKLYQTDLKKNFGMTSLGASGIDETAAVLPRSARSSTAPATRITNGSGASGRPAKRAGKKPR
jgi:transposase-like protein